MQPDPAREAMREILREWGVASVNRWCFSRGDRSIHVLEQARDMAPGTKENALRDLIGRDGGDRRRLMAAGIPWDNPGKRMDVVPMWACDPIRDANDADHPHDRPEIAVDQGIPHELMWVDQMVVQLERQSLLRGIIVRTEYTVSASQFVKAGIACETYEAEMAKRLGLAPREKADDEKPALTVRQYRLELDRALDWFVGRMAA